MSSNSNTDTKVKALHNEVTLSSDSNEDSNSSLKP